MCIMCEGADRDEFLFDLHHRVFRHGWALQGVTGSGPPGLDWVYSVGLAGGFDHPELVVLGDVGTGGAVINQLGERVRDGQTFEAGDEVAVSVGDVGLVEVHPDHLTNGLIATWVDYYGSIGPPFPPVGLLQVVLPDAESCWHHQTAVPLLSDPSVSLDAPLAPRLNRAQRRAQGRRR
jgi:hypothetical protein